MENPPPTDPAQPELPMEVQLVNQTISCQTCAYFWDAPTKFGPFPGFNWLEDYPAEMREFSGFPGEAEDWMEGVSHSPSIHRPEILDGCRKAPIMTIGINPNLTAYQSRAAAATWAYPQFYGPDGQLQLNRYAYYYRYKTYYQVSFDLSYIHDNLKEDGLFRAEKSGWLLSAVRSGFDGGVNQRKIEFKVLYDNDDRARIYTFEWDEDEHYVALYDSHSAISPTDAPQFAAGAILGGKLDLNNASETRLKRDLTGYYERMVPVLQAFTYIAGTQLTGAKLSVGEDVSQIDMVACASPGWGEKYDITKKNLNTITTNCISNAHGKAFVLKQLLQSRPPVLIIVSESSMLMFHKYLGGYFPDEFTHTFFDDNGNLKPGVDDFSLLKKTCEEEYYFNIDERLTVDGEIVDFSFQSRILVVPHFSYPDNYIPQVRFPISREAGSTINEWEIYKAKFPFAAQILETGVPLYPAVLPRVNPSYDGNTTNVWILGEDDPLQTMLEHDAWEALIDSPWFVQPNRLIARTLLHELDAGRLVYNSETGHLERGVGGCKFCDNPLWKFPDGCAYNKTEEQSYSNAVLEAVVNKIL